MARRRPARNQQTPAPRDDARPPDPAPPAWLAAGDAPPKALPSPASASHARDNDPARTTASDVRPPASRPRGGPRTPAGRSASSRNAVTHGITSPNPVIPGEDPREWHAHLQDWFDDCAPVGRLEIFLVERLALISWQMRRLVRFEVESITAAQESAGSRALSAAAYGSALTGWEARVGVDALRDVHRLLARLPEPQDESETIPGVLADAMLRTAARSDSSLLNISVPGIPARDSWGEFEGWTVALLREAMRAVAANAGTNWRSLIETAVDSVSTALDDVERSAERHRSRALLPEGDRLEKLTRYGAHLQRSFVQTRHELEAAQVKRNGGHAPLARLSYSGPPSG